MKEAEQSTDGLPTRITLHNARTLHWPSGVENTAILFLFLPGNPGLCDQCNEYLSEIHRQVNNSGTSIEIYCPSQLGHDPLIEDRYSNIVTLDEQINNKAKILETILSRCVSSKPRVILGGHSIGAWMVLEMLRRGLCKTEIHSIHLLFPAVHQISEMPNARRVAIFFRSAAYPQSRQTKEKDTTSIKLSMMSTLIESLLLLLKIVPSSMIRYFVQRDGPNMPPSAIKATTMFFKRPDCAKQALCMAHEQLSAVQDVQRLSPDDGDEEVKNRADMKMRFYWAAGDSDGWAPSKARIAVEKAFILTPCDTSSIQLPLRASVICQEDMPHAFFLRHSIEMAEMTAKLIKKDLDARYITH